MNKLSYGPVLSSTTAQHILQKLSEERLWFISPKDNPVASALLGLLCEKNVRSVLSIEEINRMIETLFNDGLRDIHWLAKYCDMLIRTLNYRKNKARTSPLSDRYEKYLLNSLIPDFKKGIYDSKQPTGNEEIWDELIDIYKVAAALYAFENGNTFDLSVTRSAMEQLGKTLRDNKIAEGQPAGPFPIPVIPLANNDPYHRDEHAYAVMLSWVLTELICDQDGITEDNKHGC